MPSETFTYTALASASQETVWEAVDRPATWESIGGIDRVVDPVIDENGRLRAFDFDTMVGGKPYRGEARERQRDEGRLIAWDIANSEISGVTTVELSPNGPGTDVSVTLRVEARGFLSSMFFSVVAKTIGNGLPKSVEEFAATFD